MKFIVNRAVDGYFMPTVYYSKLARYGRSVLLVIMPLLTTYNDKEAPQVTEDGNVRPIFFHSQTHYVVTSRTINHSHSHLATCDQ